MCYFVIHRKHSKAYKGYNHTHSTSLHQVINHKKAIYLQAGQKFPVTELSMLEPLFISRNVAYFYNYKDYMSL